MLWKYLKNVFMVLKCLMKHSDILRLKKAEMTDRNFVLKQQETPNIKDEGSELITIHQHIKTTDHCLMETNTTIDTKWSTVNQLEETIQVEGGWGWLIVVSSMMIHFIVAGLNRAAGILYLRFEEQFNKPAAITAWVTSLSVSLTLAVGPIASALCIRFSYRIVVIFGGIILAVSMIISGLSPNLYILFVSYGILGGIGKAFAYGPGIVLVGMYFKQKRALTVGLATSGVAFGAFAVPSIVELSFSQYGYLGAFLIMTGISLEMIVCGFLLRPLSLHHKIIEYERSKHLKRTTVAKELTDKALLKMESDPKDPIFTICNALNNNKDMSDNPRRLKTKSIKSESIITKEKTKARMFNFSLLKDIRFCGLGIAILMFNVAFQSSMIFLPTFSAKIGMGEFESFPVVVTGIFDGLGRIIAGFFFDWKSIRPHKCYIYNAGMCFLGITSFAFPHVSDAMQLGTVCAIYGLFLGTCISQVSVILVDFLGADNLSCGFGIILLFQGIGTFVGPPLSGLLKDINGTYDYAFYFAGVVSIVGAAVLMTANIIHHKNIKTPQDFKHIEETHL